MASVSPTPSLLPDLPRLPAPLPRSGVSPEARIALRQVLGDAERAGAAAFHAGADTGLLLRFRAQVVERVVLHAWQACLGEASDCALFAAGGYGRGLLFPQSDVDLLVFADGDALSRQARALEAFFACLWDIGLKPGHAVRTPEQGQAIALADATVFTSLLDARLLAGAAVWSRRLAGILGDAGVWPAAAFLEAKRREQARRFARYNDTAYNLEPNLKEGPGGLRTLDLMRWLGRRVAQAPDFDAMVEQGLLDRTERDALVRAEATLQRYRYALHLAAGRPEERLLFDHQRRLAAQLGYRDEHATNLAVEQFMQAYYRSAISSRSARASSRAIPRCSCVARARSSTCSPRNSTMRACTACPRRRCACCSRRWRATATRSRGIRTCWWRSSNCCGAARPRSR